MIQIGESAVPFLLIINRIGEIWKMNVSVEIVTEEAQVGLMCVCGNCHPTATVYRDDPHYKRHDRRLANGPCCCGRFFAIGDTVEVAQKRADELAARLGKRLAPNGYTFETQQIVLPWGDEIIAIVADLC